jgi:hypothetical protein
MVRFVVIATILRGALAVPEALDDANQWRALCSCLQGDSRRERVAFERGNDLPERLRPVAGEPRNDEARVVWAMNRRVG